MKNKLSLVIASIVVVGALAIVYVKSKPVDDIARVAHYPYRAVVRADIDHDIAYLEKKVQHEPQAPDQSILASLYFAQGRLTGDISWYDKAENMALLSIQTLEHPNGLARIVLAKVADARHNFTDAIRLSKEAYAEDSGKTSALAVTATSYLAKGDLVEAGRLADNYVDRTPGLESYGLRALIMNAQGRDDEALSDFKHALEIEDIGEAQESARIRSLFARFLMRRGDYAHAKLLLDEALKSVPDYHLAYDLYGELSMREGDYPAAEKYFKLAFQASKQLMYLTQYSHLAVLMGNTTLANEIQTQAESFIRPELSKNGYGHRLDLAAILLDRGHPEDIQEAVKLATEDVQNRHSALALDVLARAQLAAGHIRAARETARDLLRIGVKDPDYFYHASLIETAVKNPRQAKLYLDESAKIAPGGHTL